MKPITKKLPKKSDWRAIKLLFENFQNEYVDLTLKNYEKVSDRLQFGRMIDLLNGLRAETQVLCDELAFDEMMHETFGEPNIESTDEKG